jgi:hypothetical protein
VTEHGAVVLCRIGPELYLGRNVAAGVEVDAGYHYIWLGGPALPGGSPNCEQGVHYAGLVFLKLFVGAAAPRRGPQVPAPPYPPSHPGATYRVVPPASSPAAPHSPP